VHDIRDEDGERADVEGGVEVFMFPEDQGCDNDSVNRLEVECEIHAVGGEIAQQMDVIGVGEDSANPRENQDP